jgi:riboflavin kinase/FMN adenylyltransferase
MKVLRHLTRARLDHPLAVVTIGNFDGVHLGHQKILNRVVEKAKGLGAVSVAISFYPHPATVLAPEGGPLELGGLRQRLELISALGIEVTVLQRFTRRFAAIEPEPFVRDYLIDRLRARQIVVGYNVGFGHQRKGDATLLRRLSSGLGYGLEIIDPVEVEGQRVSSSAIRAAVRSGDLRLARTMLGRDYAVGGRVVHGHHRGRAIGFPTVNLRIGQIQLPPDGVYAVRVRAGQRLMQGVANVGFKPTFGDSERSVEAHLFDFEGDLYGERVEVSFVEALRAERRFPDANALVEQIRRDIEAARRVLGDG